MKFDYTGAELFINFLSGGCIHQVLGHPAYQVVCRHAQKYSHGLSPEDIERALEGKPSPFYGLEDLLQNLPRIKDLIITIQTREKDWLEAAQDSLSRIFPEEDTRKIVIYPIIGYDMGIGLNDAVCMNLNWRAYIERPEEFLYYLIHECTHVIYERYHPVPEIHNVNTPGQWSSFFRLMVQNEGYAVYAPFHLRLERGHMDDRDYQVLLDTEQMGAHRRAFWQVIDQLSVDPPAEKMGAILDTIFGKQRLAYRVGCDLVRNIETRGGLPAVRDAFYLDGDAFLAKYGYLVVR